MKESSSKKRKTDKKMSQQNDEVLAIEIRLVPNKNGVYKVIDKRCSAQDNTYSRASSRLSKPINPKKKKAVINYFKNVKP